MKRKSLISPLKVRELFTKKNVHVSNHSNKVPSNEVLKPRHKDEEKAWE